MSQKTPPVASGYLFKSKTPYRFYVTVGTIASLFLLFGACFIVGRLTLGQAIFCFLLFSVYIFARFGRYVAHITLMRNRIEVIYLFPWDRPLKFEFQCLTYVDHLDTPDFFTFKEYRWYRNYKKLNLSNEKKEACEIKYNIDGPDDAILLASLTDLAGGLKRGATVTSRKV